MKSWGGGNPKTFGEIFKFYHNYVKLLYSYTQTKNALPQEVLFELNAAFDHMSRHWESEEPEEQVCAKMFSHMKRSCLDIFKLEVKEVRRQYDKLLRINTSIIEAG